MRIARLAVASAALLASTSLIGCGSDDDTDSPDISPSISSPSLGSTPLGTTLDTTETTMGDTGTTLP
jgi:hypothetical protein